MTGIPDIFLLKNYTTNTDPKKAQPWFMDHDPRNDDRTDGMNVIKDVHVDGSNTVAKVKPNDKGEVRMNIFAGKASDFNNFESDDKSIPNQKTMAQKGFMFKENDWRNVEITEYVRVNTLIPNYDINGGQHFELIARGGNHSDKISCQGTSYHVHLHQDGRIKFEKEMKHDGHVYPNGDDDPQEKNVISGLEGKGWIGIKAIICDTKDGVLIEEYLNFDSPNDGDNPTSKWISKKSHLDKGNNWHTKNGEGVCGMDKHDSGHLINWGGPLIIFRWDGLADVDFKWASVREIMPLTI